MGSIVQSIFEQTFLLLQKVIVIGLSWISSAFTNGDFSPDTTYMDEKVLNGNMKLIMEFFSYCGYVIIPSIFIVVLAIYFLGNTIEIKDSISQLIIRSFICVALVFYAPNILSAVMDTGSNILKKSAEYFGSGTNGFSENDTGKMKSDTIYESAWEWSVVSSAGVTGNNEEAADILGVSVEEMDEKYDILSMVGDVIISIFRLFLDLIFFGICAWNFLKLCFELVKRYVTLMCLYMISPVMVACMASGYTQGIFLSFCKMFVSEVIVLVFNHTWIALSLYVMSNLQSSFIGMLVMVSFINFGVKIEGILKDLGLNAANTGAALLDSIAITGGVMARTIGGAKHAVSGTLGNLGSLTGNAGMVKAANVLGGRPITPEAISDVMKTSMGGTLREKTGLNGLTNSKYSNMASMLKNGGRLGKDGLATAYNSLNSAGKKQFMDRLANGKDGVYKKLSDKFGEMGNKLELNGYDPYKGFGFDIKDKDGNVLRSGTLSSNPMGADSIQTEDSFGNTMYANLDGLDKDNLVNGTFTPDSGTLENFGYSETGLRTGANLENFGYRDENGEIDNDASHYLVKSNNGEFDFYHEKDGISTYLGHQRGPGGECLPIGSVWTQKGSDEEKLRAFQTQFYSPGETLHGTNIKVNTVGALSSTGIKNARDFYVKANTNYGVISFKGELNGQTKQFTASTYQYTDNTRGKAKYFGDSEYGARNIRGKNIDNREKK